MLPLPIKQDVLMDSGLTVTEHTPAPDNPLLNAETSRVRMNVPVVEDWDWDASSVVSSELSSPVMYLHGLSKDFMMLVRAVCGFFAVDEFNSITSVSLSKHITQVIEHMQATSRSRVRLPGTRVNLECTVNHSG